MIGPAGIAGGAGPSRLRPAVTIASSGATEQFSSSWASGTGTSSSVLNDGGAWNSAAQAGPSQAGLLEVVAPTGMSYPGPGTNLFRIEIDGENSGNIESFNEVARGVTSFIRFLIRFSAGDDVNSASHHFVHDIFEYRGGYLSPISTGYTSGYWGMKFQCDSPQPGSISAGDPYPFAGWRTVDSLLQQDVWYEVIYELRILNNENDDAAPTGTGQGAWSVTNAVEFQPFISIYNTTDGSLVSDENDMRCTDYGANGIGLSPHGDSWDLGQWIAAGRTFTTGRGDTSSYSDQIDIFRRFSVGNNGQAGQSAGSGSDYIYIGDFGIYTGAAPTLIGS